MNKGFTLLEIIIVIFIILVAILGVAGLAWQNLMTLGMNYSRLTASYLAQEGVELVRNKRDTAWLNGESWLEYMPVDGNYCFDTTGNYSWSDQNMAVSEDKYICSSNPGKFKRQISITRTANYLEIKSNVSWKEYNNDYEVEAIQHLYDWR